MTTSGAEAARTTPPMWRIALVGIIAGFTSGLFGVGGGIVIVPALVLVASFVQKLASGTSLLAIVPISVSGVIGYAVDGEVDFTAAAFVAAGAVTGALIGTRWLKQVSAPMLQVLFALVMVIAAVRMFFEDAEATGRGELTVVMAIGLIGLGLAAGILAGLFGVGGGIITVPMLSMLFGIPHVLAKGTSLSIIMPTSIIGTIRNHKSGFIDVRAALAVGVAGIVSAFVASRISLGLDPEVAQSLFACLLIVAAIRLGRTGIKDMRHPHTT